VRHRAVFFDLGGTLFAYGSLGDAFDRAMLTLAKARGIEVPLDPMRGAYRAAMLRTLAEYRERPFYLHRDLFAEAHALFLRSLGAEAGAGDRDVALPESALFGDFRIEAREGAAETLASLRARGLHVSVVSNVDRDQFDAVWSRLGLADHVDAVTTSEEARSCKPDPGIFRLALAKAGHPPPESVVFVGDSPLHDVAGAKALGMTSVLIGAPPNDASEVETPHHVIGRLAELLPIIRT
jgi:putative hydrolase of the HAD superfamily